MKNFVTKFIFLIFLLNSNPLFSKQSDTSKPNILLIVADDHGKDASGCYGNPIIQTPAMDALATDEVRFTNAFCTSASCSASRSVLLTGKFNHATGHYGHEHSFHHFKTFEKERSLTYYLENGGLWTGRVWQCFSYFYNQQIIQSKYKL